MIATISFAGAVFGLLLVNDQQRHILGGVFAVLLAFAGFAILGFFASASVGYALAFIRRLPRAGQAYDCVHFFYSILGPISLVAYAMAIWPPNPAWWTLIIPATLWIGGAVWLLFGFVSISLRHERYVRRRG